mmetsp:Transcript_3099/g.6938  ORF Transcript_3099/g.6938 Transcript_3099/m.6938 type:complete len:531 (+) Transcript_3099:58-1650(+)
MPFNFGDDSLPAFGCRQEYVVPDTASFRRPGGSTSQPAAVLSAGARVFFWGHNEVHDEEVDRHRLVKVDETVPALVVLVEGTGEVSASIPLESIVQVLDGDASLQRLTGLGVEDAYATIDTTVAVEYSEDGYPAAVHFVTHRSEELRQALRAAVASLVPQAPVEWSAEELERLPWLVEVTLPGTKAVLEGGAMTAKLVLGGEEDAGSPKASKSVAVQIPDTADGLQSWATQLAETQNIVRVTGTKHLGFVGRECHSLRELGKIKPVAGFLEQVSTGDVSKPVVQDVVAAAQSSLAHAANLFQGPGKRALQALVSALAQSAELEAKHAKLVAIGGSKPPPTPRMTAEPMDVTLDSNRPFAAVSAARPGASPNQGAPPTTEELDEETQPISLEQPKGRLNQSNSKKLNGRADGPTIQVDRVADNVIFCVAPHQLSSGTPVAFAHGTGPTNTALQDGQVVYVGKASGNAFTVHDTQGDAVTRKNGLDVAGVGPGNFFEARQRRGSAGPAAPTGCCASRQEDPCSALGPACTFQ